MTAKENLKGVRLFKALSKVIILWAIWRNKSFHYDGANLSLKVPEVLELLHVYDDPVPWVKILHEGYIRTRNTVVSASAPKLERGGFLFMANTKALKRLLEAIDNNDY